MNKKFHNETKSFVREDLEHIVFELEERIEREINFNKSLHYKEYLIDILLQTAETFEEIDLWEFESQIIEAQLKQSDQEILFLKEDKNKHQKMLELVKKQIG